MSGDIKPSGNSDTGVNKPVALNALNETFKSDDGLEVNVKTEGNKVKIIAKYNNVESEEDIDLHELEDGNVLYYAIKAVIMGTHHPWDSSAGRLTYDIQTEINKLLTSYKIKKLSAPNPSDDKGHLLAYIIKKLRPDWDETSVKDHYFYYTADCPIHIDKKHKILFIYRNILIQTTDKRGRPKVEKISELHVYDKEFATQNAPALWKFDDWIGLFPKNNDDKLRMYIELVRYNDAKKDKDDMYQFLRALVELSLSEEYLRIDGVFNGEKNRHVLIGGLRKDFILELDDDVIARAYGAVLDVVKQKGMHIETPFINNIIRDALHNNSGNHPTAEELLTVYNDLRARARNECSTHWGYSIPFKDIEIVVCKDKQTGEIKDVLQKPRSIDYPYALTIPYQYAELNQNRISRKDLIHIFDRMTGGSGYMLFDEFTSWFILMAPRYFYANLGIGKAGKSKIPDIAKVWFGNKVTSLSDNSNFRFQTLKGKYLVVIDEPKNDYGEVDAIRRLTGKSDITIETKFYTAKDVPNMYKTVLIANTLPEAYRKAIEADKKQNAGLYERLRIVMFFVEHKLADIDWSYLRYAIPTLIEHSFELVYERRQGLTYDQYLKIMKTREDNQIVNEFLDNYLTPDENTFLSTEDIYYVYVKLALALNSYPLPLDAFAKLLKEKYDNYYKRLEYARGYKLKVREELLLTFFNKDQNKGKNENEDI